MLGTSSVEFADKYDTNNGEESNHDDTEILEEGTEINSSISDSIETKKCSASIDDLSSPVPFQNKDEYILTTNDFPTENINDSIATASEEWRKAKRLIMVAGLFQRRLHKGERSLSDPEIEIPNEFALCRQ